MTAVTPGREELAIEVMNVRRRIHGLDDLDLATLRRIKRDAGINEAFAIADALLARLAAKPDEDVDHPDCVTDRERELYDALMGLASHATVHHQDYKNWTQGGVTLEPIVTRALRLSTTGAPKP